MTTIKKKIISVVALLCTVMLLTGILPTSVFRNNNANAAAIGSEIQKSTTDNPLRNSNVITSSTTQSNTNISYGNTDRVATDCDFEITIRATGSYNHLHIYDGGTNLTDWTKNNDNGGFNLYDDNNNHVIQGRGSIIKTVNDDNSITLKISFPGHNQATFDFNNGKGTSAGGTETQLTAKKGYCYEICLTSSNPTLKPLKNGYSVGEYTYTGKYMTFKSDFYDYLSDEEVNNGYGNITNSNSAGWTDPYQYFNSMISDSAVGYRTNDKKITLNIINSGSYENVYIYDPITNRQLNGDWPGGSIGNSQYTYTASNSSSDATVRAIFTGNSSRYPAEDKSATNGLLLELGYTYNVDLSGTYPKVYKVNTGGTTYYNNPLYFGCFYLSLADNDVIGNTNSSYTNDTKNQKLTQESTSTSRTFSSFYNNFNWLPSIAIRDSQYTSVSGLVNDTLINGNIADKTSKTVLPYFNPDWFNRHKVTNNSVSLAKWWTNVDFPFYQVEIDKDRNGNTIRNNDGTKPVYYQFNSRDAASLYLDTSADTTNGQGGSATLNEHNGVVLSQSTDTTGQTKGFYPFNKTSSTDSKQNNLGFGTKFTINFTLSEDGKIKGLPTTFEFMGDDDVWVFVDDKLALDMGGAHKDAYGKLDFSTLRYTLESNVDLTDSNKDTLSTGASTKTDSFTIDGVKSDGTYDTTKIHTLTMYYMERGMFESDLFVRFNFTRQNSLTVENNLDVTNVNSGLVNKTKVAANYDVFDYTLTNTNITTNQIDDVSGNGLKYESGTGAERTVTGLSGTTTKLDTTSQGTITGNFDNTSGAVKNTLFERYDSYFTNNIKNVTGKTDGSGHFYLLYDETASFKRQFYSDSTMTLVQNDSLKKLNDLNTQNTLESKSADSTRKASDFYSTEWSLVDINSEKLGEQTTDSANPRGVYITDNNRTGSTDGQFTYQNKDDTTADRVLGVELKATYTNSPKVGSLKITKQLDKNTDNYAGEFAIKLTLTNIFGQSGVNAGTGDSVQYTVGSTTKTAEFDNNGIAKIMIPKGQTAIISGIPVGTNYKISEDNQSYFTNDTITTKSGTISADISESTVTNKRQTGTLELNKKIVDKNNNDITNNLEDNIRTGYKFVYYVELEGDGFDLAPYINNISVEKFDETITGGGDWVDYDENTPFKFTRSPDDTNKYIGTLDIFIASPVKIKGIPYGTKYKVIEELSGDNYDYKSSSNSDGTVRTENNALNSVMSKDDIITITNKEINSIKVVKNDTDGTNKLAGAVFELKDSNGVNVKISGSKGRYKYDTTGNVTDLITYTETTGDNRLSGSFVVTGLPNGTYTLTETTAPSGYVKTEKTYTISFTNDDVTCIDEDNNPVQFPEFYHYDTGFVAEMTISNRQITLPSTGGTGSGINYVFVGVVLVLIAGAGFVLVNRKAFYRKKN